MYVALWCRCHQMSDAYSNSIDSHSFDPHIFQGDWDCLQSCLGRGDDADTDVQATFFDGRHAHILKLSHTCSLFFSVVQWIKDLHLMRYSQFLPQPQIVTLSFMVIVKARPYFLLMVASNWPACLLSGNWHNLTHRMCHLPYFVVFIPWFSMCFGFLLSAYIAIYNANKILQDVEYDATNRLN